MTIRAFDFAHQSTTANPKHVASLVKFFESGVKQPDHYGFGVEIEHLPIRKDTGKAVTYAEPRGIRNVLQALTQYYDPAREYYEDGHLLGLGKPGIAVSLEPGGQIECSLGVLKHADDLDTLYAEFRHDLDPILDKFGIRLVNFGYQPDTSYKEIEIIPKHRYYAMQKYFGRIARFGFCMMRASASTQVSIDYFSEHDAIDKLRIGTAIGPILAWFFRNTPNFEKETNPYPLLRQEMWDWIDPQRTGQLWGLYDDNYDWEHYAVDVLTTPVFIADLSHTPEYTGDRPVFSAPYDDAATIYPDRELNQAEINHIISTHFNDVRLKNFVELRSWDSLPIARAQRLTEIVSNLFYTRSEFEGLLSYFDGLTNLDVREAKAALQAHGADSRPYGQSLDFWREFLHAEGTLDTEPGDPLRPDFFQA
ncbi:glutamate-cysteine ligase family protein [Bifidobacterium catulorum]|uniref:Glutamate--cysteine ligase n=1 Tax=Bifidobacterium catulorum TaxID=1630173 RepID=A0A2U2MT84_9BIFI|nr:glutamate-cysteine ligase family protein [Bifidobacterium catulorum]PWG60045.1 gamma-glutamylcysteine synthetase [Bifidobacterium catulorum]